jgi:DHA3 family macrolide efflux protein-like MFS transporter
MNRNAAGLPPRAWLVGSAAFLFMFSLPMIIGCLQPIWQTKVAPDIQGRVFAARRAIGMVSLPVAMLVAGPLAEKWFEPWLAPGGALADSVGRWIGTGPGRGIGFLFMLLGALTALGVFWATRSKQLMHVETILPDAIPNQQGQA